METLNAAIQRIKLDIATLDYGGARYIKDKAQIAASFNHSVLNDDCGYVTDPACGKVWVVYRDGASFRYHRAV